MSEDTLSALRIPTRTSPLRKESLRSFEKCRSPKHSHPSPDLPASSQIFLGSLLLVSIFFHKMRFLSDKDLLVMDYFLNEDDIFDDDIGSGGFFF